MLAWGRQHASAARFAMWVAFMLPLASGWRWLVATYGFDMFPAQDFIGPAVAVGLPMLLANYLCSRMGVPRR
jgi:hypothetical protein